MLRRALKSGSLFIQQPKYHMVNPKRKPFSKNLDKYEIVIVGGNSGAILSSHLDAIFHGHHTMFLAFDRYMNEVQTIRISYEQQRASKQDYSPNTKMGINMYLAHSEMIGVETFQPDHNKIILRNGREISYDYMVVAMGMEDDSKSIKGLEDAWKDVDHPVHMPKEYSGWKNEDIKYPRYIHSYQHGDAFFYIPPFPLQGDLEAHNYFTAWEIWHWKKFHGGVSPVSSFTIVNANDIFVPFQKETDAFIKEELKKRGIRVLYNTKLNEIDKVFILIKKTQTAYFTDLKHNQNFESHYTNFYSLIPRKPHQNLIDAGLATQKSNLLLDVDIRTLRHNKYKNIFGLGDVCNLPTTKTFWASMNQVHVVRENLTSTIKGKPLNAEYDGYSKGQLIMGQNTMTYMVHYYNGVPGVMNLFGNIWPLNYIRYLYWAKNMKKKFLQFYLFKNWGPPFYKFKKRFGKTPIYPNEKVEPKVAHHH